MADMQRWNVGLAARILGIPNETVRASANRTFLKWLDGGEDFLVPVEGEQRKRFFQFLGTLPQNRAEQIRADMGIMPRRSIPKE